MQAVTVSSNQTAQLDGVAGRVRDAARGFAQLAVEERLALLRRLRVDFHAVSEATVFAACRAKGIDPTSSLVGEEWLQGPLITLRYLRLLQVSLEQIRRFGAPRIERAWIDTLEDGRLSIKGYPLSLMDGLLLPRTVGRIHLRQGITRENLPAHQARFYRAPHQGRVCLVLGGGNVNAIPTTDVLHKLFIEGAVCILKMNPVNAYLGPLLEQGFAALVEKGYLQIAYGGAEEGAYLVEHPAVDEVHITGSDKTYDAMVWGPPGAEREARKARREPLLHKPVSSELGNISPVLWVPGPYSRRELAAQTRSLAGMVINNASFNCNSAKLLVTAKGWRGRDGLLDSVGTRLSAAPVRKAYYPGAEERWKAFTEGRAGLRTYGQAQPGELPWALIPGVDPQNAQDRVFHQEPWCALLSETSVGTEDPVRFLEEAVRFVNDGLWGTLCATIVIHPRTLREPEVARALDLATRTLRYGTVAINTWPATVFALGTLPWGGHPSSTPEDIQSGTGFVHNTLMLEGIEKAVIRGPLLPFPPMPWEAGHRSQHVLARRLAEYEYDPRLSEVPGFVSAALQG
jgi:aldehyde dehydrogenase (NAD(P)+)